MIKYYLINRGHIVLYSLSIIILINVMSILSMGTIVGDNLPYVNVLIVVISSGFILYDYQKYVGIFRNLKEGKQIYGEPLKYSDSYLIKKSLKTIENHYESKLNEYETKSDELDAYLTKWAHEIKIPVSVLNLIAESLDVKRKQDIGYEIERINYYILQLLTISREQSYETDLFLERMDILPIINQCIRDQRTFFEHKNIELSVKVHSGETQILSDKKWITYIMSQLLHNSYKYSNKGSQIEVNIDTVMDELNTDEKLRIQVVDHGIGIKEHELRRIFDKGFIGTNGRNQSKSTGMGLYLVKKISHLLNIDIQIESDIRKGTTVTLIVKSLDEDLMLQKCHFNS